MSAQADRAIRRDLRRAVGAEAISVIDHNARVIAQLQQDLANLNQRTANLYSDLRDAEREHYEFTTRTFWPRLRWLFTGK